MTAPQVDPNAAWRAARMVASLVTPLERGDRTDVVRFADGTVVVFAGVASGQMGACQDRAESLLAGGSGRVVEVASLPDVTDVETGRAS